MPQNDNSKRRKYAMPVLTEKQIQYGYFYPHSNEFDLPWVTELREWQGQSRLTIQCTQLSDKSYSAQKRIVTEWCNFLRENPHSFTTLHLGTRASQEMFDAVCFQENLEELYFKWAGYTDISSLRNLHHLKFLHIGSGASIQDIQVLGEMESLIVLSIENFQKIEDYSVLGKLQHLEQLNLSGDWLSPHYIHVSDLEFLREIPDLLHLNMDAVRLLSHDFSPVKHLKNLRYLTLSSYRGCKKDIMDIRASLPHLQYGLVAERPDLYGLRL